MPWLCASCAERAGRPHEPLALLAAALRTAAAPAFGAAASPSAVVLLDVWGGWSPPLLWALWQGAEQAAFALASTRQTPPAPAGPRQAPLLLRAAGPVQAEELALQALGRALGGARRMQALVVRAVVLVIVIDAQDLWLSSRAHGAAPDLVRLARRRGAAVLGLCCPHHGDVRPPGQSGAAGSHGRAAGGSFKDWAEPTA